MNILPILPLILGVACVALWTFYAAYMLLKKSDVRASGNGILGQLAPILLWLGIFLFTLWGIMALVRTHPGSAGGAMSAFEPFQDANTDAKTAAIVKPSPDDTPRSAQDLTPPPKAKPLDPKQLTSMLRRAMDDIEDDMATLAAMGDATCALVKEAEEGYVGSKSGDVDESEYSLPQDEIKLRRQTRVERAKNTFNRLRKVHASTRSKLAPLECFQDAGSAAVDADVEDLHVAVLEMATLLENQEVVASMNAADQMTVALQFTDSILKKANQLEDEAGGSEGFQTSASDASSTSNAATQSVDSIESTVNSLSRDDLMKMAIQQLKRAQKLHEQVASIKVFQTSLRAFVDEKYQKVNRVQSGKVTTQDISDAQATWDSMKSGTTK